MCCHARQWPPDSLQIVRGPPQRVGAQLLLLGLQVPFGHIAKRNSLLGLLFRPLGTWAAAKISVTQNFSGFVPRFIRCQHLGIADGQLFLFAIAFEMANPALPAASA